MANPVALCLAGWTTVCMTHMFGICWHVWDVSMTGKLFWYVCYQYLWLFFPFVRYVCIYMYQEASLFILAFPCRVFFHQIFPCRDRPFFLSKILPVRYFRMHKWCVCIQVGRTLHHVMGAHAFYSFPNRLSPYKFPSLMGTWWFVTYISWTKQYPSWALFFSDIMLVFSLKKCLCWTR